MKKMLAAVAIVLTTFIALPAPVNAVDAFEDVCKGAAAQSTVCKSKEEQRKENSKTGEQQNPLFGESGIITMIVNLLSAIAGIIAVIVIILGGLKFITSGSNPQDISNAREMVIYAAIGLIIAVSAQLFVRLFLFKIT
jgi:hypothetical protein